jgi:hypothetical protein
METAKIIRQARIFSQGNGKNEKREEETRKDKSEEKGKSYRKSGKSGASE